MNRSGHKALSVMKQYEGNFSTSNFNEILKDKKTDSILISTRHDSHFNMAMDALKAGKNVLVEKPLTLDMNDLKKLSNFYKAEQNKEMPLIMVAYNRRFSPHIVKVKNIIANSKHPCIINYEMNAGYIEKDNWVYGKEGGGRNIGEACHIYDLFNYLLDSKYSSINVKKLLIKMIIFYQLIIFRLQ